MNSCRASSVHGSSQPVSSFIFLSDSNLSAVGRVVSVAILVAASHTAESSWKLPFTGIFMSSCVVIFFSPVVVGFRLSFVTAGGGL